MGVSGEVMDKLVGLIDMCGTINTQDNRATAYPMYVVQLRKRIDCIDGYNFDCYDGYYWLNAEWDYYEAEDNDMSKALDAIEYGEHTDYKLGDDEDFEEDDELDIKQWDKVYYRWRWEPVQWFFTEKGAEEFIATQRHNLHGEVRIYAESAHNNKELKAVIEFLRLIVVLDETGEAK